MAIRITDIMARMCSGSHHICITDICITDIAAIRITDIVTVIIIVVVTAIKIFTCFMQLPKYLCCFQADPPLSCCSGWPRPSCPSWSARTAAAMDREIWASAGQRLSLPLQQQVGFLSTFWLISRPGLISAINMWSVKWSARLQNVLTVAKLVSCCFQISFKYLSNILQISFKYLSNIPRFQMFSPLSQVYSSAPRYLLR